MRASKRVFTIMIFIAIFIKSIPVLAQTEPIKDAKIRINYKLTYQPNKDKTEFKRVRDVLLLIGEDISQSLLQNLYIRDSIFRTVNINEILSDLSIVPRISLYFQVFKNHPAGKITTTDNIFTDFYIYEEEYGFMKWELLENQKELSGFNTRKAITTYGGREWIAWFTTEIPIHDGPYKFHGLPGLILQVYDSKKHYNFEFISLTPVESTRIYFPTRTLIPIKREEYIHLANQFREHSTPTISMSTEGNLSETDPTVQQIKRNVSEENNPIELKAD
jgi:GLPGLI family protein